MKPFLKYVEDVVGFKLAVRLKKVHELAEPIKEAYVFEAGIEEEYRQQCWRAQQLRDQERAVRDQERQEAEVLRAERKHRREKELAECAATGVWDGKHQSEVPSEQHESRRSSFRQQTSVRKLDGDDDDTSSEMSSLGRSQSNVFTFTQTGPIPFRLTAEERDEIEREYNAEHGIPIDPPPPTIYGPPSAILMREGLILPRPPSTSRGVYYQRKIIESGSDSFKVSSADVQGPQNADAPVMFRSIAVTCLTLVTSSLVAIMAFAAVLSHRWLVAEGTTPTSYPLIAQGIVATCTGAACNKKNYGSISTCGASGTAIQSRYEGVMALMCLGIALSVALTVQLAVVAFRISQYRGIFARLAADKMFFLNRREALDHRAKVRRKKAKIVGEVEGTRRAAVVAEERAKLEKSRVVVEDLQNLRRGMRSTMHTLFSGLATSFVSFVMLITGPALYQHTEDRFIFCGTSSCDKIKASGSYSCGFGAGYALAVCAALFASFTFVLMISTFVVAMSDVYTSLVVVGSVLEFEEGSLQRKYLVANQNVASAEEVRELAVTPLGNTPTRGRSPDGPTSHSNPLLGRPETED